MGKRSENPNSELLITAQQRKVHWNIHCCRASTGLDASPALVSQTRLLPSAENHSWATPLFRKLPSQFVYVMSDLSDSAPPGAGQGESPAAPQEAAPSVEEQKKIIFASINAANETGIEAGKFYSLIPTRWWRRWKDFVGYSQGSGDGNAPGPIDNSDLLETVDGEVVVKKVRHRRVADYICAYDCLNCIECIRNVGL